MLGEPEERVMTTDDAKLDRLADAIDARRQKV
jgi:hypothetical protein